MNIFEAAERYHFQKEINDINKQLFELGFQLNNGSFNKKRLRKYLDFALSKQFFLGEPRALSLEGITFNPRVFWNEVFKRNYPEDYLTVWSDSQGLELKLIDFTKVTLLTCLIEGESSITGIEKLERLKKSGQILLGGNVFFALWSDWKALGTYSVLEWLWRNLDIRHLDFYGSVYCHDFENNEISKGFVFCLTRYEENHWTPAFQGLDDDCGKNHYPAITLPCP